MRNITTDNWKAHAERMEKQGRLNQARITLMIETIDELKEERESLLQRINLLTIAGDEALKQRNDALDEAAGHKESLIGSLERNIKLAEYCGEGEREVRRLREALKACWDVLEFASSADTCENVGIRLWNGHSRLTEHPNPIMPRALEGMTGR